MKFTTPQITKYVRDCRTAPKSTPSKIKDIKAGKPSINSNIIDKERVGLKIAQSVSKKRKPSMPKMPWENLK